MTVPEPVDASTYRRAFGLAWLCVVFAATNVAGYFAVDARTGWNLAAYRRFLLVCVPCNVLCVVLAAVARSIVLRETALRAMMAVSLVSLLVVIMAAVWLFGSKGSPHELLVMLLIAWARGVFDARMGRFAALAAIGLGVGLALGNLTGALAYGAIDPLHAGTPIGGVSARLS